MTISRNEYIYGGYMKYLSEMERLEQLKVLSSFWQGRLLNQPWRVSDDGASTAAVDRDTILRHTETSSDIPIPRREPYNPYKYLRPSSDTVHTEDTSST
jgi:hypothetical protein